MEDTSALTAIAIDKDRNSQLAVKWAVDNLLKSGSKLFLVHVLNKSLHPQDSEVAPVEGRPPSESEMQLYFLSYRGYCARKGIQIREVIINGGDVPTALVDYINNNNIGNIVVGASSRNVITRKLRNPDVPTTLLKCAPESCGVYVISKGKVQVYRLVSSSPTREECMSGNSGKTHLKALLSKRTFVSSEVEDLGRSSSTSDHSLARSPLSRVGGYRFVTSCKTKNHRIDSDRMCDPSHLRPCDILKTDKQVASPKASKRSKMPESDVSSSDSTVNNCSSSSPLTPRGLEVEMRRLRNELKRSMDMFRSVSKEAIVAKEKLKTLQEWKEAEERRLEEARIAEEAAVALAEAEKEKTKAAMEAAQAAQRLADMEAKKRKLAELRATREEEEKKRVIDRLVNNAAAYRRYTTDEIERATDYFASEHKIGEGGYGSVFKATMDHTSVAIKVLRPDMSQGQKQFQQEVEVLSCMRHPHLVLLIGACPENGCLVYEYMENGSLEDRLYRNDDTPSIPWRTRFRIASEIATSLLFLHQTKPEPLVHRDLKPANILLDQNYVSKISDVGLSRLVPAEDGDTQYRLTQARGTFCYIDPEYQQTGLLGVKSDLYSFGVVLLQLITSKSPVGLPVHIQEAIEKGTFAEMLDPTVSDWPIEEALSLAKLALQCCELRKKDRPDLGSVVLPELNRLRNLGLEHEANISENQQESNNSENVSSGAPLHNSVSEIRSQENQIAERWRRLRSKTRVWKSSTLPSSGLPTRKPNGKPGEPNCWSFVTCNGPPQQFTRGKSFSA